MSPVKPLPTPLPKTSTTTPRQSASAAPSRTRATTGTPYEPWIRGGLDAVRAARVARRR